jgi:hypothetical protein
MREMRSENIGWDDCKRLRSSSAWVYETTHYYILRSYGTFVAVLDKKLDILYDVLRTVYGYTSTSARHIAKFNSDYSSAKWRTPYVYTAREV